MKTKFLIATALASILASAGMASAQSGNEGGRNAPGASGPAASAPEHAAPSAPRAQNEPKGTEQKGAPQKSAEPKGAEPKGAMSKPNGAPNDRMGQSEPKGAGKADRADADKSGAAKPSAQTEQKSDKTPAAAQNERGNDKRGAAENKTNENRGNTAETRDSKRPASASLSTEQRTKIRETVIHANNAPRLARTDINVSITVGERIPRDRIHIRPLPLPDTVVEIAPEWRGYDYFLVGDELVVVDPDTFEIVAVLPA